MSSVLRSAPVPVLAAVLGLALTVRPAASQEPRADAQPPRAQSSAPLKIGIIGTGHIGGTLATLWVGAGHEVLMSSRHPQELQGLAHSLGPKAHVGTPAEAARFGEVC